MTEEIYTQLLELYVQDLENENTGLHLQVKAYEILKDYKPPAIVSPYKDPTWPHQYPIWCVTTTESSQ
jgi:hypothetical protein